MCTSSKAIHDANQARTIEGVLAALLGVSLIVLFALLYLFLKTRRRLREARSQLASRNGSHSGYGDGGGGNGIMSEKPGNVQGQGHYYSPSSGVITPRAGNGGGGGRNGEVRNPFDDASAVAMHQQQHHHHQPRSPFLGMGMDNERGRQSVTSLISAVPSNGARSTAGNSAISTEFYHTYKASTMPPSEPSNSNRNTSPFGGGFVKNLFAPMSFFSSATPSPNPSRTTSRSGASATEGHGGDTSTLNTDYYGDRNSITRPETSRSAGSSETIHDSNASNPITRLSTRSEFTSSSSIGESNTDHLAPSSSASSSGTRSMTDSSRRSSSSNRGDISLRLSNQDVYDDSDAASFSNFSFVDTGALNDLGGGGDDRSSYSGGIEGSDEGSTTIVEPPRNPFREPSPGESFNKRRSWNREYTDLDRNLLGSTASFDSK